MTETTSQDSNIMPPKHKIRTFAVFDIESTNIPDHNFNKANITEISFHGIAAKDFHGELTSPSPRVTHKLTLLFNPLMMIHPSAEALTGLNNYILEEESSFDSNAANVILSFLKHLIQPVCLVAHNGNNFDFPLLKQAFVKLGVEIPSDIMCIDTLVAIKELDRQKEEEEQILCSQEEDYILNTTKLPLFDVLEQESEEKPSGWQKLNETTPKKPPKPTIDARKRRLSSNNENNGCTPQQPETKIKSRRSLFGSPSQVVPSTPNKTGEYNLTAIHARLFSKPPEVAHHAEGDVTALKRIIFHYGKSFVDFAESNATRLVDAKKVGASR